MQIVWTERSAIQWAAVETWRSMAPLTETTSPFQHDPSLGWVVTFRCNSQEQSRATPCKVPSQPPMRIPRSMEAVTLAADILEVGPDAAAAPVVLVAAVETPYKPIGQPNVLIKKRKWASAIMRV